MPSEGLVLGEQFVAYTTSMLQQIATGLRVLEVGLKDVAAKYNDHGHTGQGATPPVAKATDVDIRENIETLESLKTSPIDDKMILSNIAFTERVEEDAAE